MCGLVDFCHDFLKIKEEYFTPIIKLRTYSTPSVNIQMSLEIIVVKNSWKSPQNDQKEITLKNNKI
ncbi:MAG: hypothetical protein ACLTXR_07570 [Clostridia bacterium]